VPTISYLSLIVNTQTLKLSSFIHPHNVRVTLTVGELVTISKNNLISSGIRLEG